MHSSRLWRLAAACRRFPVIVRVAAGRVARTTPAPDAPDFAGTVVDQSGQALPRACVRLLDPGGSELAATFADETGRFRLSASSGGCRIEASLTGFETATVPCATEPARVVLGVAPVRETVVV